MMGALLGWVVLAVLTALAAFNGLGLALRSEPAGRAELGTMASAAFFGQLVFPTFVLGYAGALTPVTVGVASAVSFLALFGALVRGRSVRGHAASCAKAAKALALLPVEALRDAERGRSLVAVALLYTGAILLASIPFTVFVPNETYDGFLYHEPIVGFALQNHGFAIVHLPPIQAVQAANGYPHVSETLNLWFVVFTDKTLIELPIDLAAPAMMLAAYALVRRYGDRLTAVGWSCVLFLLPQVWSQLCQTLVDIQVAFFALVALYFTTRPTYRVRDAWWASLGLALLVGSKGSGLVMVPPIALLAYGRLLVLHGRPRRGAALAGVAGGGLLVAAVGITAPLRNWLAFGNPIWPVTYENRAFGIRWSGLQPLAEQVVDAPLRVMLDIAHDVPVGGMRDVIARGYGYAFIWVVLPLGCIALVLGLGAAGLEWGRLRERTRASNLGMLLVLLVVGAVTAPTLAGQNARYNTHLVVCVMAAVTWLLAGRAWARAREGVLGACIVLSIIPLYWMGGWGWTWVSTEHPEDVLRHPLDSRTALARPSFDLLAANRNAELRPGDWVVLSQDVAFVGALWNFDFSNRVKYVKYESSAQFVADAEAASPKWIAVGRDGDARKAIEHTRRWELVGEINRDGEVVFRRKTK